MASLQNQGAWQNLDQGAWQNTSTSPPIIKIINETINITESITSIFLIIVQGTRRIFKFDTLRRIFKR